MCWSSAEAAAVALNRLRKATAAAAAVLAVT